jgi:hypothetical protein
VVSGAAIRCWRDPKENLKNVAYGLTSSPVYLRVRNEQPFRKRDLPLPGPREVLCVPSVEQPVHEITPEGVRLLADFILLLAKWDRMLKSPESEMPPETQQEAA